MERRFVLISSVKNRYPTSKAAVHSQQPPVCRRQRLVDRAFRQVSLLHSIDVGLVVVVIVHLGEEVRAFVVHAALEADARRLRLRGAEVMVRKDVEDCAAVGDNIALESPLVAQLIDERESIRASGLRARH